MILQNVKSSHRADGLWTWPGQQIARQIPARWRLIVTFADPLGFIRNNFWRLTKLKMILSQISLFKSGVKLWRLTVRIGQWGSLIRTVSPPSSGYRSVLWEITNVSEDILSISNWERHFKPNKDCERRSSLQVVQSRHVSKFHRYSPCYVVIVEISADFESHCQPTASR